MKLFKKIASIVGTCLVGLLLLMMAFKVIDKYTNYNFAPLGYRSSVVISNSMATVHADNEEELEGVTDRYTKNDVVYAYVVHSYEELNVHDVILYYSSEHGMVVHRIIAKYAGVDEQGQSIDLLLTRGDANNVNDDPVTMSQVKGKVNWCLPKVGSVALFFQSYYGLLAVSACLICAAAGYMIYSHGKEKKAVKDGPAEKPVTEEKKEAEPIVEEKKKDPQPTIKEEKKEATTPKEKKTTKKPVEKKNTTGKGKKK